MAHTKRDSSAISLDESTIRHHREIRAAAQSTREAAREAVARARALLERLKERRQQRRSLSPLRPE